VATEWLLFSSAHSTLKCDAKLYVIIACYMYVLHVRL